MSSKTDDDEFDEKHIRGRFYDYESSSSSDYSDSSFENYSSDDEISKRNFGIKRDVHGNARVNSNHNIRNNKINKKNNFELLN